MIISSLSFIYRISCCCWVCAGCCCSSAQMTRIASPGPGKGCRHTICSDRPSSIPNARTSSLWYSWRGSIMRPLIYWWIQDKHNKQWQIERRRKDTERGQADSPYFMPNARTSSLGYSWRGSIMRACTRTDDRRDKRQADKQRKDHHHSLFHILLPLLLILSCIHSNLFSNDRTRAGSLWCALITHARGSKRGRWFNEVTSWSCSSSSSSSSSSNNNIMSIHSHLFSQWSHESSIVMMCFNHTCRRWSKGGGWFNQVGSKSALSQKDARRKMKSSYWLCECEWVSE